MPFGSHVGGEGELVGVFEQQAAVRRTHESRRSDVSLRRVAAEMAQAGHKLSYEEVEMVLASSIRSGASRA